MKKKRSFMTIAIILIFIATIGFGINEKSKKKDIDISAWVVDWDLKRGIEEVESTSVALSSIQLFAAYFNEEDNVFLNEKSIKVMDKSKEELEGQGLKNLYLTVVNDIVFQDGKSIQKDSNLISRIMKNEEKRKGHIEELVKLVDNEKFVGIELDYEKIESDVWDEYALFIEELGVELEEIGKQLRIVLEPMTPLEEVDFPKDYEYVMMAYNLYGSHSGPGPKADKEFIKNQSKRMKGNFKNMRMAFALGGFDWVENEKVKAVTEIEAQNLVLKANSEVKRDKKSNSVYFNYTDDSDVKHTVWYADRETISTWMKIAYRKGMRNFAFWRLGGNTTNVKVNK